MSRLSGGGVDVAGFEISNGEQKHSPKKFYPIYYGFLDINMVVTYNCKKRCFELVKNHKHTQMKIP